MRGSVAGKLTVLIILGMLVVMGTATLLNVHIQERTATTILELNGAQIGDLVAGAAREGMLHNDRLRIQRTIDALARQRDIERIRIVAKRGRIAYSTATGEVGQTLGPSDAQCLPCHSQSPPPRELTAKLGSRFLEDQGQRLLGVTRVIPNDADCSTAACHAHAGDGPLLGILDVHLAMEPFDQVRRESTTELAIAGGLGLLVILGITVVSVQRMVHLPVRRLITGVGGLGRGDLAVRVPEGSRDELGRLGQAFNLLARDLEVARSELIEWGETLERRVEEKTNELQRAQDQILHVEKMASLGKLAAVVAHEINNPLSSVVTYAKILARRARATDTGSDICRTNLEYLDAIGSEAARCGEIVAQLLAFARRSGGEFVPVHLNEVVERAVFLVHHKLELTGVDVALDLAADLPPVLADAGQLQQALLALLINACEAMDEGGRISVRTDRVDGCVRAQIADTGPGMTPEVAQHVFEPFFTTKDETSGVGLGLSVVYGIIERHNGRVQLETAPGRGTRFIVTLHEAPPAAAEEAEG